MIHARNKRSEFLHIVLVTSSPLVNLFIIKVLNNFLLLLVIYIYILVTKVFLSDGQESAKWLA